MRFCATRASGFSPFLNRHSEIQRPRNKLLSLHSRVSCGTKMNWISKHNLMPSADDSGIVLGYLSEIPADWLSNGKGTGQGK